MMPVDSSDDPHGPGQVRDHCDLAEILYNVESERMLTVQDHSVIRNLYRRLHGTLLRSATSCQKVIKRKRQSLRNPVIRNYEPPKHPLHTAAASQMALMDLFGFGSPSYR
jgi:hypothetical protein